MAFVTDVPVGTKFDLLGYAITLLESTTKSSKFSIDAPPGSNFQVQRIGKTLVIAPLELPAKD